MSRNLTAGTLRNRYLVEGYTQHFLTDAMETVLCICARVNACYLCIWRPEVNAGCISQSLFETSLTKHGYSMNSVRLAGHQAPGVCLSLFSQGLNYRQTPYTWVFTRMLGNPTQVPMLTWQAFYWVISSSATGKFINVLLLKISTITVQQLKIS